MTNAEFETLQTGDRLVSTDGDGTVFEVVRRTASGGWKLRVVQAGPGFDSVRAYSRNPQAITASKWRRA